MMFSNIVIAASGNLGLYKHGALDDLVTEHGGKFSEIVDANTTHLVCSSYAYGAKTQKVESAIAAKSVTIVNVYWIMDSVEKGEALSETAYLFSSKKRLATRAPEPEEKKDKKRPLENESESSGTDAPNEICPRVKRTREKDTAIPDGMEGSAGEVVEGIEKAVKSGLIIEFDLGWISRNSFHVYRDEKKTSYEKCLAKIDVQTDTSTKVLIFQVLESDTEPRQYALCCVEGGVRKAVYGRSMTGSAKGLGELISVFESELEKRTLQGYVQINLNYSLKQHTLEAAPSKQTLESRNKFYKLLKLILGQEIIPKKLEARTAEYDRLVLKNISKATIDKGKKILAILEKSIANPPQTPEQAGIEKVKIQNEDLARLTSNYYSYVPRLFVAGEPILLLNSCEKVREEINMLGILGTIRKSAVLAKNIHLHDNGHEDTLREHFELLNLRQIDIVDNDSQEFKLIERYFTYTSGRSPVGRNLALQIFRIERLGDEERWNKAGWNRVTKRYDNRRLLWHGTPRENVSMILKKGLEDVSGEGGVYFSDTAQTSLDYCQKEDENPPFAMLLCEVQLGYMSPYNSKKGCSIGEFGIQRGKMNYRWSDAGVIHKSLEGVQVPDVEKPNSVPWEHVEWVARHSPSQIKHRYLVICR